MIPIQIMNDGKNFNNTSNLPQFNLINGKPGCKGFNGNLNSWYYGITSEYKDKMEKAHNSVGILAQYETVNSPYYTQVHVDPNYIRFLQEIANCNK